VPVLAEIEDFVRTTLRSASRGCPVPTGSLLLYGHLIERLDSIERKLRLDLLLTDDERYLLVLAHEEMPRGCIGRLPPRNDRRPEWRSGS
jgi:hypothetical protein